MICVSLDGKAQIHSEYDQLVYVNPEWRNQRDVDPQLKLNAPKPLNEQQLIQLHLFETEKLLRKRDVCNFSPVLKENRTKNLDVLHQYLVAGVFPLNTKHQERQPYFIDDNNVYCAVGFLMKESGADDVARDINKRQNYSYLVDIHHEKLMSWVQQSGLTFDELALIQPTYGLWPATIVEFHYNNTGADVNEYIEIHQSSGEFEGMIAFDTVRFYDGAGTLYKTLPITQMESFHSNRFYYYLFPGNESFADDGRIEISGTGQSGSSQLISVITYTDNSVQVHDYHFQPGFPAIRTFNIGESESSAVNLSLQFCDFYYNAGWDLETMSTTIGALNACLILPIGLSSFSSTVNDKKVILNWETVSETNNRQFIVERSLNGTDFETIGTLPGAGNSNTVKQYVFTDNAPGYINHYRLKQIDFDGRFVYSKILYIKVEKASPLQIMENVVSTHLRYQVNSGMNESRLEIYDMTGRNVYKADTKEGVQLINVSSWSAGKYLIRLLTTNGQVYSHQFIKQ